MNDPLDGFNAAALMAAAALPTDAEAPRLTRDDLPSVAEIAAAFPELEIHALIGHGGMSAVYKATQPKLGRVVALKVLPKALAAAAGFAERFSREGRILARLNHPSIVTVHDFGQSSGFGYLIMEYMDGVNLRQAMRAGRLTPEQALGMIPGLCDALQAAHGQGILHRDIKPENILLDTHGRVKIADFGIAKIVGEDAAESARLTQSGARLGTAPYMAPEQIERPSLVDHRADIYSLGVVFYEMLTGELPLGRFAAPSERAAVHGRMDDVVFRALAKELEDRQQSAGELKTELADVPAGIGPAARLGGRTSFEYTSRRRLWGLPLLHVVTGPDPLTGKRRTARGVFAFGDSAEGLFALGGLARGVFAFGGIAFGLVSFGGLSFGLLAIGGLAVSPLLAAGGLAVGPLAMGGVAMGWHANGGVALGYYAAGGMAKGHQGLGGTVDAAVVVKTMKEMPPLSQWLARLIRWSGLLGGLWLPVSFLASMVPWWAQREAARRAMSEADRAKMVPRYPLGKISK
jgi:tRNA A-37 threonylcarbamoyl transferase component Bud32